MFYRRFYPNVFIGCLAFHGLFGHDTSSNNIELDYATALENLISQSNLLKVSELEIGVKESELYQLGLYHNPEFTVEYDNGDDDCEPEVTYTLSQTIELGGKHTLERRIAGVEASAASWDYEIKKLDLINDLAHAFIDAAAAQEKMKLAQDLCKLSEDSLNCVQERFQQGKSSALDHKKSAMHHSCKKIAAVKAIQNFEIAKKRLVVLWGLHEANFNHIKYPFYLVDPLPPFSTLEKRIDEAPEYSKAVLGRLASELATKLEYANQYPDVEVSAGITTEKGCKSPSFCIEIGIPLPIFDRNHGNISKAIFQEWQTQFMQEQVIATLKANLLMSYSAWETSYHAVLAISDSVKTIAEEHERDTKEGYEKGKFEMLEWLEAQKTSLEIRDQYIEALADYHHNKANTLRVLGDSHWNKQVGL